MYCRRELFVAHRCYHGNSSCVKQMEVSELRIILLRIHFVSLERLDDSGIVVHVSFSWQEGPGSSPDFSGHF